MTDFSISPYSLDEYDVYQHYFGAGGIYSAVMFNKYYKKAISEYDLFARLNKYQLRENPPTDSQLKLRNWHKRQFEYRRLHERERWFHHLSVLKKKIENKYQTKYYALRDGKCIGPYSTYGIAYDMATSEIVKKYSKKKIIWEIDK